MGTTDTVTVKDIAQRASVSVGTVSRVFHNHANVGDEIRTRVLQAAADLGYKKPIGLRSSQPASRALKEIGFLYCSAVDATPAIMNNPFWSHILNGVEKEAQNASIKVTYAAIHTLMQTPQALVTALQAMKLDGILLVGPAEKAEAQLLRELNIPLVLVDNHIPGLSLDSVLCDNFEGASLAVNYLLQQGHQRIAFIGGPLLSVAPRPTNSIYTLERRSAGYRTTLLDAGLAVDYQLFESTRLSPGSASEACQRLLQRDVPFSAVFCANDEIALGVMKALREAGKRVPEDVSVIGFDDIPLVEHLSPALTTMRVNKEALGAMAVKTLMLRAADPQMPAISTVLEVELVERETVRYVVE